MFWFLQSQAFFGVVLALTVFAAAANPRPGLDLRDAIGAASLVAAVIGEAVSDQTLHRFARDPRKQGTRLRHRPLALVAASELFLRMARLARLSDHRDRFLRRLSLGLRRADRTRGDILASRLCLRHTAP